MKLFREKIWFLLAIILVIVSAWNFPIMGVWKSLVVYVHETFHALGAILTGSQVQEISLISDESGVTKTINKTDFSFVVTVSFGYIGSSLTGGFFLYRGFQEKFSRVILFCFSLIILTFSYIYTFKFASSFQIILYWCLFFLASALISRNLSSLILITLGTCMSLYSIYDLVDFMGKIEFTDAGILAKWILGEKNPTVPHLARIIALIWSVISIGVIIFFTAKSISKKLNEEEQKIENILNKLEDGSVKPDVAEWFIKKGVDFDGKPISKEILEKIDKDKK
ncbi:MAG: M50 family metallopeptidase [Leptospiraceae bacterium]|nr:M50 family metallopeptidase [Leptospiraceae bacterium]